MGAANMNDHEIKEGTWYQKYVVEWSREESTPFAQGLTPGKTAMCVRIIHLAYQCGIDEKYDVPYN